MTYMELLRRYRQKHKGFVEPRQGWDSLHDDLWLAYSMGRVRGFTDLGTYVDKPGDHGYGPPAWAFDLGRRDHFLYKGWDYLVARRLVQLYVKHHLALNIDYVILGNRIWSRERGWHSFTRDTSHYFHIHVSGYHPQDKV